MLNINILNIFNVQMFIILVLLGVVLSIARLNKVTSIERRYKPFCVEPINDDSTPIIDKIKKWYFRVRKNTSKFLLKTKIFNDYSKKYEKYCDRTKIIREEAMDYISDKVFCGMLSIVIIILSDVLRYKSVTFFQIFTVLLVGFFIPDIFWKAREKVRHKQLEKDMLKAIIIMNNSFKSGLSIMQAIYMVSKELDGPISEEFKKMYIDISFGLEMDLVFERFASRVNTEDAKYITTSLSVLNRTGGNIVQVFASVERSAFTRKKLKEELGALSASANAIFKILIVMPVLLSIVILILNPTYFAPLFSTNIGILVLGVILLIYFVYIFIVRRVIRMKG